LEIAQKHLEALVHKARPDISVIICVYTSKRWNDIREAVASVRRQSLPAREIVIVVDYNAELLTACEAEFPDVKVLANDRDRGLSGARNTGIARSTGELVAFLDDDAVADASWLAALAQHFERVEVMGVTACIDPIWTATRPDWLPSEFLWTVGCSFKDEGSEALREVRNLFGGAMAVRRSVFTAVGAFTDKLGRQGSKLPVSCEETEFCIRAKAARPEGVFLSDPAARIGHKVPPDRTTWRYFLIRCYAEGISKAFLTRLAGDASFLDRERSYVARTLTAGLARGVLAFLKRAEVAGLKRALAILLGLGATGAGYLVGRLVAQARGDMAPVKA
jgi:glucosyl-dolichyl phosphate glucuronosyltransferase